MACSMVIPIFRQASAMTVCMLSVGVCCALKLEARATAAPASARARAGGNGPPVRQATLGRSVARVEAPASKAASSAVAVSR